MKKSIAIVGGGTAGLFAAAFLDTNIYDVTIYDKKPRLGRKFLVAGDGGFNLTHSEPLSSFKTRYTPSAWLDAALEQFSNEDLRAWMLERGVPTFVGSSGRVFPEKGIKPIEVLRCIEQHLMDRQIRIEYNKTFTGWNENEAIVFEDGDIVKSDYVIFAMGGASWKITGSDGAWIDLFQNKGIETIPFRAANCAYEIDWSEKFISRNEGTPLKNIAISHGGKLQKGEAVITALGVEGNAIYGLSSEIQKSLDAGDEVIAHVDFKPTTTLEDVIEKLTASKENTTTTLKEKLKIPRAVIDLIKESTTKEQYLDIPTLAQFIKEFPLTIIAPASIDEAISTMGGISLDAITTDYELKGMENSFCIGEMLDWNAPTGGYLIQACASMGVFVADKLNNAGHGL